jgi:hypothetical protein
MLCGNPSQAFPEASRGIMHPFLQPNSYRVIWIVDFTFEHACILRQCESFLKYHNVPLVQPEELVSLFVVHCLHTDMGIQVDGQERYFELWSYGLEGAIAVKFTYEVLNHSNLKDTRQRIVSKLPMDIPLRAMQQSVKMWVDRRTLKLLFDLGYYTDANNHPTTRPPETTGGPFG